jgi:hypothetical protein
MPKAQDTRKGGYTKNTKIVLGVIVGLYFVSPIDLLPDIFPPFTYLDDLGVILWYLIAILGAPTIDDPGNGACPPSVAPATAEGSFRLPTNAAAELAAAR